MMWFNLAKSLKLHPSLYFLPRSFDDHLGGISLLEGTQSTHVAHHVIDGGVSELDNHITFEQSGGFGGLVLRHAIDPHPFATKHVVRYYTHRDGKSWIVASVFCLRKSQLIFRIQCHHRSGDVADHLYQSIVVDQVSVVAGLVIVFVLPG